MACIGFGGRVVTCFPPRAAGAPATLCVRGTVAQLAAQDESVAVLTRFPGPLAKSSHDAVLAFVSDEAERALRCADGAEPQKEQVDQSLLWKVLGLLCKHYGSLDARPECAQELSQLLLVYSSRDKSAAAQPAQQQQQQEEQQQPDAAVLDELRWKLCAGNKLEALQCAVQHRCWALALALAQQISPKCAADTTAAFARECLPDGDPLRSFVLVGASQPAEVFRTAAATERWLENVAMFLANRSAATRSLTGEMGDRLWKARTNVAAAHVCYLIADSPFCFVDNPSARLVLLGADHKRAPGRYVTAEAIQATECYEHARTESNPQHALEPIPA